MIISPRWLKEHIDFEYSYEKLSDKLTSLGLECNLNSFSPSFCNVIVGKVKSIKKIENSDHLNECIIDIGDNDVSIVCGAPNIAVDILVPVAIPGATLYSGDLKIKKTIIRGVESNGMVCSEKELGIGDNHDGIMILNPGLEVGIDFLDVIKEDYCDLLEIDLTPNRGDCLGHLGVARELSIIENKKISLQKISLLKSKFTIDDEIKIKNHTNNACLRYCSIVIKNVSKA